MATNCAECPLRRLPVFDPLTPDEVQKMQELKVAEVLIAPGEAILRQGEASSRLYTVLSGMGLRHMSTVDGRRQIVNFLMPGDFVGLQGAILSEMAHTVEATTPMVLCVFERQGFWNLYRSNAGRAYDVTWLAATEEHFLGDALATIGQRSAIERLVWAIVRIYDRARSLNLTRSGVVPFPYRQQDLADALGLSLVHTNKTLARLRQLGLVHWQGGLLSLHDLPKMRGMAGLDATLPPTRPLM